VKPLLAVRAVYDAAEHHADQLSCTQAGRVTEVEQEARALRGRHRPAMRLLQPVGKRPDRFPFAGGEGARDVRLTSALRTAYLEARERIPQHLALFDEPAEHRAEHRKRRRRWNPTTALP
jgi:hypothetical protein